MAACKASELVSWWAAIGGKAHLQQGRPVSVRGTGQAGEGNGAGVQWTEMLSSNACLKVIVAGGLCGVLHVL